MPQFVNVAEQAHTAWGTLVGTGEAAALQPHKTQHSQHFGYGTLLCTYQPASQSMAHEQPRQHGSMVEDKAWGGTQCIPLGALLVTHIDHWAAAPPQAGV